jgi:hypothetical protein
MDSEKNRPWWTHTNQEMKQQIEEAIESYLSHDAELTDRQQMLLRDAIGYTYRGLFGMAFENIRELTLPDSAWSPSARVEPMMVEGVTRESLRRALYVLHSTPVQNRAYFNEQIATVHTGHFGDGMDPPAFPSAEVAGTSLRPRISLEEARR